MELLKEFPRTENQFNQWFWDSYKQPPDLIFEPAPFVHQCEAIWRFLGYPVDAPNDATLTWLDEYTRNVLYIYESLLIKYPEGPKDILKELKEISYSDRILKYPELEQARDILHSLNEAIVEVDKYKIKARPLPSLSDAITMLKIVILRPKVEDTFWDDIKIKNRIHETAPF